MKSTSVFRPLVGLCCLSFAVALPAAENLKSPETIKIGLRIVNQVVGHTGRLIAAKNYEQVPREQGEFMQGAALLREAVAAEPEAFKSKVEQLLTDATDSAHAMGMAAKAKDDTKLASTHAAFAAAVKAVVEAFPQNLRPSANPRRRGGFGRPPR